MQDWHGTSRDCAGSPFLGVTENSFQANLGTVESRTIKQARKHVQVKGRGHGQVLTGMILCMFYLILCL